MVGYSDAIGQLAPLASSGIQTDDSQNLIRKLGPEEMRALRERRELEKLLLRRIDPRDITPEVAEELRKHGIRICYVITQLSGHTLAAMPSVVYSKDNRIVRVLPFQIPEYVRLYQIKTKKGVFTRPSRKAPIYPPSFAWRQRVYSPTRVRYPLKRVDWSPENRNPQNRGKSKFVRISWDEAIEIIASEIERIRKVYGSTQPVLVQADGHGQTGFLHSLHFWGHRLFHALGTGWTHQTRNPDSWEGWYWGAKHVWGFDATIGRTPADAIWDDVLENAELILLTGGDPESTGNAWPNMMGTITMRWIKQAGIKIVAISPDLNYTAAVHADKWIPIRPNTDAALYFAIAYLWIQWGTYDKKFIETHTVGFEEFRKYVLGEEDGVPKTPEWAEKITGVPVETIKALARAWVKKKTTIAFHYGGPKIRGIVSHLAARAEAYVMMMQGLGAPGRQFLRFQILYGRNGLKLGPLPIYPDVVKRGTPPPLITMTYVFSPPVKEALPLIRTLVPEAIINPPVEWYGVGSIVAPTRNQFQKYRYPPTDDHPGIHMIWMENGGSTTSWNYGWRWVDAYRHPRIEFIVAIHPWIENDVYFADLILPAQTVFEHEDLIAAPYTDVWGLYWQDRCIDPVGESKSDYEIHRMLAQRLGVRSVERWFPEPDEFLRHSYEMTIAYTKLGITWEEFKRRKLVMYDAPTPEEWERIKNETEILPGIPLKPGMTWYYELPEGRGLGTKSGKMEFVSGWLKDYFPDDKLRPPLAKWIDHEELPTSPKAKKYPLQVMSNHPRWRHH
ncbi:MAG: molybdopterin-dependent oxidoreductase, partial [Nitrososphaeria archaeon]